MITDLKAAGVTPLSIGSKNSSFAMWEFNEFLSRYGWEDSYEAIAAGEGTYNNPEFLSCFEKIKGIADAGAFTENMTTLEYFDAKQLFDNGTAAMFGTGQWDCAEFDENLGENVGFFWGPVFEDSKASQEVAMKVPSAPLVCSSAVAEDAAKLEALYAFIDVYYGEEAAGIAYAGSTFPATSYTDVAATDTQYAMNAMFAIDDTKDADTNQILMLANMNKEALQKTIETGKAHYWSTSRNKIWLKGESSGHFQEVKEILVDCDMDAIVLKIKQTGAACHEGYLSCFFRKLNTENVDIEDLKENDLEIILERLVNPDEVY